jgi:molybdenum-dependent DNA-binding transcriptional regulator ModE
MADYKLKLEIDAAELQKQLETAFKKGIKGFSGGGSQGANTVAGQKYFKQEEKMKKQMNRLTLEEKKQLEKHTIKSTKYYVRKIWCTTSQNV